MTSRWVRGVAATAAVVLAPVACRDDPTSTDAFSPSLEDVECPSEVQRASLVTLACGYLTVLENRSDRSGGTVRIFVVRSDPPDADPVGVTLGIDEDLGAAAGLGAGPGAARTHSVVYQIHPRGTGRSEPSLACPEVDALAVQAAEAASTSTDVRDAFRGATRACHDRLVADGIDPAAYDVRQSAADIEDLRRVLDIDRWNLSAQGTYSRFQLEVARRWPEHIGYVFLDSPQFPGSPDPVVAVPGLDYALQQLTEACAAEADCAAVAPDLANLLTEATVRLDREPVTFTVDTGRLAEQAGRPVTVLVDGPKLLRAARAALGGDGPGGLSSLPATIAAAARGETTDQLVGILGNDPLLCAGYRPLCPIGGDTFSMGVYLTTLCRDQAPFVDQTLLADAAPRSPAHNLAYAENPYLAACETWDVPAADGTIGEAVNVDVPMLIVTGQLDSYSPAPLARQAADHLPNAHVLEVPGQTHNVMGFGECQIEIRNAWIVHPDAPPEDTTCLDTLRARPIAFAPST